MTMRADAASAGALGEALELDPTEGQRCWKALARVEDDEPTYVWQEGDSNGITVSARLLTGPFVGAAVVALVAAPLGGGLTVSPFRKGQRILIDLLDGRPDGLCVATASVPGGKEDPIPTSIAGVPLDSKGMEEQGSAAKNNATQPRAVLFAPPKGIGHREYYRGAIKVIRLKGQQSDFFSGFVVSADDGTTIQMSWNGLTSSYGVQIKDKAGAQLAIGDGIAALVSPDGKTRIEVSNGQILITSDGRTQVFGSPITLNHGPADGIPTPATGGVLVAKAGGSVLGVGAIAGGVFVGGAV